MPDYQLIGPYGAEQPTAIAGEGKRNGDPPHPAEVVLTAFPAPSWDAANQVYLSCRKPGHTISQVLGQKHGRHWIGGWWHFPGAPGYLIDAAVRLGVSIGAVHKAEQETTIKGIATPLGESYSRYQKVKGPTRDNRDFTPMELRDVGGHLAEARKWDAKLHAMADAGRAMIEDCAKAHGLPAGEYRYRVVGPKEADVAPLRAEIARLEAKRKDDAITADLLRNEIARVAVDLDEVRSEHAELFEQNKQLAAMVEQLTTPAAPAEPTDPKPTADPPKVEPPRAPVQQPSKTTPPRPQHRG
jgi:uncharacterized small protein (DUF1192 family)